MGARVTGSTCKGGGMGGGSIDASACVALAVKSGGGGGGGRTRPWFDEFGARGSEERTEEPGGTGGGGGGGKGGKGAAELFTGNDAFLEDPQVCSVPRQWQHRFVWKTKV